MDSFEVSLLSVVQRCSSLCSVYDVLTGAIKLTLRVSRYLHESREKCVRDVAWHPHENYIISTSVSILKKKEALLFATYYRRKHLLKDYCFVISAKERTTKKE